MNIKKVIKNVYENVKNHNGGKVADYIPELACVDPNKFAVSVCDINGNTYHFGDSNDHFCLQSCSKPLSYCKAYDELGKDNLHKHVGYEPSGQSFNAFILNKN